MKKSLLCFLFTCIFSHALAEEKLTGRVLTIPGKEPVVGATVVVIGTHNATLTDLNGQFALAVHPGETIRVSFLGYEAKEILITASMGDITVELQESATSIDDVVVIGYGTQKKVNLTGAITTVDVSKLEDLSTVKLSNALAGRAAGVQIINNSGFAGASSSISIRGSAGEPLFVINGVIRDKLAFDNLDPNEVENISFLKDASSAAIYGSKAGNGVVLVTTKKGSKGRANFQYKGSFTLSSPTQGLQEWSAQDEIRFINNVAIYRNEVNPTPDFKVPYDQSILDYFADKTYQLTDVVWRNPTAMTHTLSIDGGTDQVTYYLLAGLTKDQGSFKNVDFTRYNLRSDITAQISDAFKINLNIGANQNNGNRFYWPYDDAEGTTVGDFYRTTFNWSRLYPFFTDKDGNPSNTETEFPVYVEGWNPVDMVNGNRYRRMRSRNLDALLRMDMDLGKILRGLSASASGNYGAFDKNSKAFVTHNKAYNFQRPNPANPFQPGPPNPNDMSVHNVRAAYENITEEVWLGWSYQINAMLNYKNSFDKHNITVMFAYEQAESGSKYLNGRAENLLAPIDQIFAASSDTKHRHFSGNEGGGRLSFIGRVNYNFDERYIAEFSFREDGNDKFARGYRWGFFPSVSAAWRISQEKFFRSTWLSNLKLRLSYGSTGDDGDISAFQWQNKYVGSGSYFFGSSIQNGITIGASPNPVITWATLKGYDLGVDFGMFQNRLTGEFGIFYKERSNILGSRIASMPDTFGRDMADENYAKQEWRGAEASLRWINTVGEFSYSVYGNIGYVVDNWLVLDEPANLPQWKSRIGHPNGFKTGYIADGLYRTQADLDALPAGFTQFGVKPRLGMIRYVDIRGANEKEGADGKIDGNDWDYISRRTTPRINFGFGGSFSWRGIQLDIHFQGVGGHDKFIENNSTGGIFQIGGRPYFEIWAHGDTWTKDNINASLPASVGSESDPNYGAATSTFWKRNGAYIRLKNLSLGYTFPKQWMGRSGIKSIQVFANGTNLFCISDFDYYDIEQATIDSFPIMRSFTIGLSISF